MGWARFDDAYTDHPKIVTAGPLAELLDMRAILFSARYETDGHIPPAQLSRIGVGIPAVKKRVAALVEVERWHEPGHGCKECPQITDGWAVHDYLLFNPSRDEQTEKREHARRRYAMNADPELRAAVQERDGGYCRYCGQEVNWRDRRSPQGGTYDHVIPITSGGDESMDNIVTACRGCNQKKGPRTPDEAGMILGPPRSDLGEDPGSGLDQNKTPDPAPPPKTKENLSSDAASGADPVAKFGQQSVDLARHLGNRVQANGHKVPAKGSKNAWAWFADVEKLLRIDGADPGEVRAVIDWATADEFWRANMRSANSLRDKYSQLRLQMLRVDSRAAPDPTATTDLDEYGTSQGVV